MGGPKLTKTVLKMGLFFDSVLVVFPGMAARPGFSFSLCGAFGLLGPTPRTRPREGIIIRQK